MSKTVTGNERIHSWLGLPSFQLVKGGGFKCLVPSYSTDPAAAIALLEAVRAKGYGMRAESHPTVQDVPPY